ncbi:beta strand repeat-containing protein [Fibrella forsythiae]|uniref:beta strand repeat-containing protein n=1 Tax=Fibrella forsythiae TaxID=2817061 RepID=UPI001E32FB6C|nr:TMF family protein [Fibrella forsythiae]
MKHSTFLSQQVLILWAVFSLPLLSQAQTNYVANTVNANTPGTYNTLVGPLAGSNSLTGEANTFVGYGAGNLTTNGRWNAFIGANAGYSNTTGIANVFTGYGAGNSNTTGAVNVFIGSHAGYFNTTGSQNVFSGYQAGYFNTTGYANVFTGYSAGYSNTTGNYNVFTGNSAGQNNTTGYANVFTGFWAGYSNSTGGQNTFLGYQAGFATTSSANTFLGYKAGFSNTSGQYNSFIGVQAGQANTTGSSNYFFGTNSGASNTTGTGNYFLGDNAGGGNTSGGFNIYIGANAGNGRGVNGDNNLAIGFEAGKTNQSGINNTFLGFRADAGAGSLSNATAIGNNAKVTASNSLILGSGANVGIGNTAPTAKLHLTSNTADQSGLRLENLTSASPAAGGQSKFLTVDANGNVILGTSGSGRIGANELWSTSGEYLHNANAGGVVIGQGIDKLPLDYNLFVSKGILTERVKVAVKNTSEWSDKVFAPTYQLQPLAEVASYITLHQHLPGVPSAQEMVERGNDLHQTDTKLLEKIEELTLYSIQLEKAGQLSEQKHQQELQQQQLTNQTLRARIDKLERMVQQLLEKR